MEVVADTTKVRIFKQITTLLQTEFYKNSLLLIPQRYEFSSKSQQARFRSAHEWVVADTTKVRIFKQITTSKVLVVDYKRLLLIPQRYEFSSKSQPTPNSNVSVDVVADTTKVRIFKQITTRQESVSFAIKLLLIPQRYEFSSKSQQLSQTSWYVIRCCWYHKGTNFQANHNTLVKMDLTKLVVADTTKVRIFKQITTQICSYSWNWCCCWYHKGTNFQANHNSKITILRNLSVVADTTKVRIFKQITTPCNR